MGKHQGSSSKRAGSGASLRGRDRADRREAIARRKGKETGEDSWFRGKRPIFRFVAVFAVLVIAFNIFFYAWFKESSAFQAYLHLNASVSGMILRLLGEDMSVAGASISSPRFSLVIALGCDAIQPTALFVCAVLASPVSFKSKWPGLLVGAPLLLVTNLVRIVSLYYAGVAFSEETFKILHVDVWQAAFIFLALLFWILWARSARQSYLKKADAST
ncbi:MAG: archaeosortase/exosortase family protein [Planctomycetota bacterium]